MLQLHKASTSHLEDGKQDPGFHKLQYPTYVKEKKKKKKKYNAKRTPLPISIHKCRCNIKSPPASQTNKPSPPGTSRATSSLDGPPLSQRTLLSPHTGHDLVNVGLDHDATHNHLVQGGVHGLKPKDQVQLAHILKDAVQRLDKHLDQVDQGER